MIMLEELQRRNYSETTIRHRLGWVEDFASYFRKPPDKLSRKHLRTYQAYLLKKRKLSVGCDIYERIAMGIAGERFGDAGNVNR